jgi:hypothetical protein
MKIDTLKPLKPLLISMALLTSTVLPDIRVLANTPIEEDTRSNPVQNQDGQLERQQPRATSVPKDDNGQTVARMDELEPRIVELEKFIRIIELEKDKSGFFGIDWRFLLNAGSPLIGFISLLIALDALRRVKKQSEEAMKLNERHHNLLKRIGGLEVQMERDRIINRNQAIAVPAATLPSTPTPTPPTQPSRSVAQPSPQTNPGPETISKATLISALNSGDRQPLRAAAKAELNITSESENALAMGKAIATELEEVAGGGSYWLLAVEGQDLLFPTDRTLRGLDAVQRSKGIFRHEQQTIAQPKLIEPALLERSGSRWTIKSMGRIAMP